MGGAVLFLGTTALALIAVSVVLWLAGLQERSAQVRGLALLAFLAGVGVRAHSHFSRPADDALTPASLFGARFVSYRNSGISDLVVKREHGSGELLAGIGDDAIALGAWMAREPSRAPSGDVAITARALLPDRYGAPSEHEVLTLRWPREEWLKVRWETVSPQAVVVLADLVLAWPTVKDDLERFCGGNAGWRACARLTSEASDALR
jgi:hypothetical protein